MVLRDGISVITAGLDHWFKPDSPFAQPDPEALKEFTVEEWRLQKLLQVDFFCLPPEHRQRRPGIDDPNAGLRVPVLRFPRWHVCPACHRMEELDLSTFGHQKCKACHAAGKHFRLIQVRFIAMCDHGHVQDFPWREWVHRSSTPACSRHLKLIATGGAGLGSIRVECECGSKRNLENVTSRNADQSTYLSNNLTGDKKGDDSKEKSDSCASPYLCRGLSSWLGDREGRGCGRPLVAALRNATNVYYADTKSSIYLPLEQTGADQEIVDALRVPAIAAFINLLKDLPPAALIPALRGRFGPGLEQFPDPPLTKALAELLGTTSAEKATVEEAVTGDDLHTAFRRPEYRVLRQARRDKHLEISPVSHDCFSERFRRVFSGVYLIKKLRETRVLNGFTRIFPENDLNPQVRQQMLRREAPIPGFNWLPAYVVFGEGLFLEFEASKIAEWENRGVVAERVRDLQAQFSQVQESRHLAPRLITPRLVALHTLSHLLLNRLTFECGYSSASLRERLYISSNPQAGMAGILIYTASGDSEGTLGGLVRMGSPESLESVLQRALEGASWCSADPVCMELGDHGGQGPDSCNLAACHNCCLLPETSCEEFNRFLDRGLLVGTPDNADLGLLAGY
jgi:hypothetical protein